MIEVADIASICASAFRPASAVGEGSMAIAFAQRHFETRAKAIATVAN